MARILRCLAASLLPLLPLVACAPTDEAAPYDFSSDQATLMIFEFDGRLVADSVWDAERAIEDQLLYTIGHLNGDNSVGRFDKLELSNVERSDTADGKTLVTYHAKMPVAWGSKTNLPESYDLTLPLHVDADDYQHFVDAYGHSCVDWGAHDVDSGSMWYYYRPHRSGCDLASADVFTTTATATVSPDNTSGKYPEYHEIWGDDHLTVVAIFGKYEDGATTSSDSGISAYNRFVGALKSRLGDSLTTEPANVPQSPGIAMPDITFRAALAGGKSVEVVALLVDNVRTAGPEFDARYAELSTDSDLIFYNGHAGLGANVRALAQKGKFKPGKYQLFFMNGCDTFAYVDGHLAEARAVLNPDDPTGTRYMDMMTNVMPSFFHSMPSASMAVIEGLLAYDAPKTYEEIFAKIDKSEVVVVTGEQDNVYYPGYEPGQSDWAVFEASGSVAPGEQRTFELGEVPPGSYSIVTAEDPALPGGDVDLYVAVGRVPTLDDYDHRPYLDGSVESVTLTLDAQASVYVMIHGYEGAEVESSAFLLTAKTLE